MSRKLCTCELYQVHERMFFAKFAGKSFVLPEKKVCISHLGKGCESLFKKNPSYYNFVPKYVHEVTRCRLIATLTASPALR